MSRAAAETHVVSLMAEAMHERVYGHEINLCEPSICQDPVGEFATEALAVLRDDLALRALAAFVRDCRPELAP